MGPGTDLCAQGPSPPPPAADDTMILREKKWQLRSVDLLGEVHGMGGDGGRECSVTVDHMLECLPRGGKKKKGNWAALKLKICKKFFSNSQVTFS